MLTDEELSDAKQRLYDSDQRVTTFDRQGRGGFSKPMIRETYEPRESAVAYRELGRILLAEVARLNAEARRMTALHAQTVEELDAARAEVEREQQARRELTHIVVKQREIVRAVAGEQACWYDEMGRHCGFCDVITDDLDDSSEANQHAQGCKVPQARALLARDEGAGEDEGSAEG